MSIVSFGNGVSGAVPPLVPTPAELSDVPVPDTINTNGLFFAPLPYIVTSAVLTPAEEGLKTIVKAAEDFPATGLTGSFLIIKSVPVIDTSLFAPSSARSAFPVFDIVNSSSFSSPAFVFSKPTVSPFAISEPSCTLSILIKALSSSVMTPSALISPVMGLRTTKKFSSSSAAVSPLMLTVIDLDVSPGAKTRVPDIDV